MHQQNLTNQPNSQHSNPPVRENQEHDSQSAIAFSRPLPPTLLRINADNQDKRAICIFWVIFFAVIIAITIASTLLPNSTFVFNNQDQLKNTYLQGCTNPSIIDNQTILQCNPNKMDNTIGNIMLNLVQLNQFVIVYWKFVLKDNTVDMDNIYLKLNNLYGELELNQNSKFKLKNSSTSQSELTISFRRSYRIYGNDGDTLLGYQIPIYIIRDFQKQSGVIIAQINSTIADFPNISKVDTQIQTVNPKFTQYTLVIRYVFFAFSLAACIIYMIFLKKIPAGQKITQQKMIAILSVLLVFFNDPFYTITVLQPNKVSSYFSVFFVINFVIFLIFLWIIFLDRIYYEDGQKQTQLFNWKRIVYIVITYIVALILYTLIAMQHIDGLPILQPQNLMNRKLAALQLFALLLIIIGFGYIFISYIRLCMRGDEMLWRNQLFLFFSVFFIVITIVLFFVNGFEINTLAGNRLLLLYTSMNMYTFYMQYMYSLSRQDLDRVQRGQIQHGQNKLLQIKSGQDGDCVDLQFDDMPGSKINTNQKLGQFVNRQKQKKQIQQVYSPKYGQDYQKDLNPKYNMKEVQQDKQTDFFKQNLSEDDEHYRKKQNLKSNQQNKKQQFDQFSLDD